MSMKNSNAICFAFLLAFFALWILHSDTGFYLLSGYGFGLFSVGFSKHYR